MGTLRQANWEKWKLIPEAEVWKVVALLDVDPDYVSHVAGKLFVGHKAVSGLRNFTDRLDVVVASLRHRDELKPIYECHSDPADSEIQIAKFAHFARSVDWDLPPNFPIAPYKSKWLACDAWNEAELRDLLCGLEPNVGRSAFTEINDAAEAIRRAAIAGELHTQESPAAIPHAIYGTGRLFKPSEAARWATAKPGRFSQISILNERHRAVLKRRR
jgi:hypothetical protein